MKLWWVYAGEQYYPSYALGDLQGTFEEEWEANLFAGSLKRDWVQVVHVASQVGVEEET